MAAVLALAAAHAATAADVEPCKVLTASDVRRVLGPEWKFVESVSGDAVCGYMAATNAFTTLTLYYSEDGAGSVLAMRRTMADVAPSNTRCASSTMTNRLGAATSPSSSRPR